VVAPIRAVIVEDHALVRTGLRTSLAAAGIETVGEAGDGVAGLEIVRATAPDVAIVDVGLPGVDGIALTRALKELPSPPRVLVLTMQEGDEIVFAAIAAGADGYCVKSSDGTVVGDAVRAVAAGSAYFDAHVAGAVLRKLNAPGVAPSESPLTPRETEVLKLVAEGVGNVQIAERLGLGLGTVKGHVADILEKLAASDRAHAAVTALRRGLIS